MVAIPQIVRKLIYKRREKWFLQRAVQRAVQPQTTQVSTGSTPAEILAQWDAEGMGISGRVGSPLDIAMHTLEHYGNRRNAVRVHADTPA